MFGVKPGCEEAEKKEEETKKKPLVNPTTMAHTQEVEEHTQEVEEHTQEVEEHT